MSAHHTVRYVGGPLDRQEAVQNNGRFQQYRDGYGQTIRTPSGHKRYLQDGDRELYVRGRAGNGPGCWQYAWGGAASSLRDTPVTPAAPEAPHVVVDGKVDPLPKRGHRWDGSPQVPAGPSVPPVAEVVDPPEESVAEVAVTSQESAETAPTAPDPVVRWIPEVGTDEGPAALAYAETGIFVLPTTDPKNPGSWVGRGWPRKSSVDPVSITDLWSQEPHNKIAGHMGPSRLVAVDVDHPEFLPDNLRKILDEHPTAFQRSREGGDPYRGHNVYALDPGDDFGSSRGDFEVTGEKWGEIRAGNAVIMLAPSVHEKAAEGGLYHWIRRGVARRPDELAAGLRPPGTRRTRTGGPGEDTVTDDVGDPEVAEFLAGLPDDGTPCDAVVRLRTPLPATSRHPEMCHQQLNLVRHGEQGHYGARPLLESLELEFVAAIADRASPAVAREEYRRALRGAVRDVTAAPTAAGKRGCCGERATAHLDEPVAVDEDAFWDATPELAKIRAMAVQQLVAPWALFGVVLGLVAAYTGAHVRLPGTIGGHASLNLLLALVGRTGVGKDAALAVAVEMLDVDGIHSGPPGGVEVLRTELGTGQGVSAAFTRCTGKSGGLPKQYNDAAVFTAMEVDSLKAHADMGGATIMSVLKSVYSGSELGAFYADPERRRPVKAHRYRGVVIAGVQPERSGVLLADRHGGQPQRWLWLSCTDPALADRDSGASGDPIQAFLDIGTLWKPDPEFLPVGNVDAIDGLEFADVRRTGFIELVVAPEIQAEIRAAQIQRVGVRLGVKAPEDTLDSQARLTRLKTAAVLAQLTRPGDRHVTVVDWELAGVVLAVSDRTRAICEAVVGKQAAEDPRRRGIAKAHEAEATELYEVKQAAQKALRCLKRAAGEWVSGGVLQRALGKRLREYREEAIEALVAAGAAESEEVIYNGQTGMRARVKV